MNGRFFPTSFRTTRTLLALMFLGVFAPAAWGAASTAPWTPLDEALAKLPHTDASGTVVTTSGLPVAGADVFLYYESALDAGFRSRLAGRVKTDAQGKFIFKKAVVWETPREAWGSGPVQKYDVIARDPRLGIAFTVFLQDDPADRLKVTMTRPEYADLSAQDTDSKPMPGVKVYLGNVVIWKNRAPGVKADYYFFSLQSDIGLSSGVTDKDGKVRLPSAAGASFRGDKDGYVQASDSKKLTLYPAARISGRVTDPQGRPLAGAAVWYEYRNNRISEDLVAVTDAQGRYELQNLPANGYSYSFPPSAADKRPGVSTLSAQDMRTSSELVCKTLEFQLNPGDNLGKNITMVRGHVLDGQVVDALTGRPVPNVRLSRSTETDSAYLRSFSTDQNGRFRLVYSPGRHVELFWSRPENGEYLIDQDQVQHRCYEAVMDQPHTGVVLKARLWQVAPLRGTVLGLDGKPARQVSVYLHPDVPTAVTGEDGTFTLKLAPSDRDYDLYAKGKDAAAQVHLAGGATSATLRLEPTRTYHGVVLDEDGKPADGLQFHLDLLLNDAAHYRIRSDIQTTTQGTFTAKGLFARGTYDAWWSSDAEENRTYDNGNTVIDLAGLKTEEPIRFTARHFVHAMMGKVRDEKGKPVAGAQLKVVSSAMTPLMESDKTFTSDEGGNFTIPRLKAGRAAIRLTRAGATPRVVDAPTDCVDLDVQISPKGGATQCRIQVLDEEQKPLARAPLTVRMFYYNPQGNRVTSRTQVLKADAKGRVEVPRKLLSGGAVRGGGIGSYFSGLKRVLPVFRKETKAAGNGALASGPPELLGGQFWCDLPGHDFTAGSFQPGEQSDLSLIVRRGGEHWGCRVVDAAQRPLAGARVAVTAVRPEAGGDYVMLPEIQSLTVVSGRDGRFELSRLGRQGDIVVKVSAGNLVQDNVDLTARRNYQYVIKMAPGGAVAGRVVAGPAGRPLSRGYVMLESPASRGKEPLVGSDGTFTANGLVPGEYKVRYSSWNEGDQHYLQTIEPKVNVSEGQTTPVTIALEEGIPVLGKVVDKTTGQAVKQKIWFSFDLQGGEPFRASAGVQPDGSWKTTMAPGTYQVRIHFTDTFDSRPYPEPLVIEKGKAYNAVVLKIDQGGGGDVKK